MSAAGAGLVAAVALAGCAAGPVSAGTASRAVAGVPPGAAGQPAAGQPAAVAATAGGAASPAAQRPAAAGTVVLPALADRSVIRTATVQVRVSDVVASAGRVSVLAGGAGGYVADEQTQIDPDHPGQSTSVVTLRIPGAALTQVLSALARMGVLLAQDQSSNDVTGQVIDVAARLASQQASVDRIRVLLAQANTIGEVVAIEGELATREGALESLQGQAKQLADQTSLATVTVTFVGPQAAVVVPVPPKQGFGRGLSQGWAAFTSATSWLLTALGAALPFAVLVAAAGAVVAVLRRRRPGASSAEAAGPDPA